jgi:hypothetical protein
VTNVFEPLQWCNHEIQSPEEDVACIAATAAAFSQADDEEEEDTG